MNPNDTQPEKPVFTTTNSLDKKELIIRIIAILVIVGSIVTSAIILIPNKTPIATDPETDNIANEDVAETDEGTSESDNAPSDNSTIKDDQKTDDKTEKPTTSYPDSSDSGETNGPDEQIVANLFTVGYQNFAELVANPGCDFTGGSSSRFMYVDSATINEDGITYKKTATDYKKFIEAHFGMFSEELRTLFLRNKFKNVNGALYCSNYGGMSGWGIINAKATKASSDKGIHKYNITYHETYLDGSISKDASVDQITIKETNGKWRITSAKFYEHYANLY